MDVMRRGVVCVLAWTLLLGVAGADEKEDASATVPDLVRALSSGDGEKTLAATRALGALGAKAADAVEALRENLVDAQPQVRIASLEALTRIVPAGESVPGFILDLVDDPDANVRQAALEALVRSGAEGARLFCDRLRRVVPDAEAEELIRQQRGEASLSFLLPLLDDPSWHVRRSVIHLAYPRRKVPGTEEWGKVPEGWWDRLERVACADPSSAVRHTAARALREAMRHGGKVASHLEVLLARGDERIRRLAAGGLTWAETLTANAERLLRQALTEASLVTRATAALALRVASHDPEGVSADLRLLLEDEHDRVRVAAATSLVFLGARDAAVAELLAPMVSAGVEPPYPASYHSRRLRFGGRWSEGGRSVSPLALESLARLGPLAAAAVRPLLVSEHPHVRLNAIHFLGRDAQASRAVLESLLDSEHESERCAAACILVHAGLATPPALDLLLRYGAEYEDLWRDSIIDSEPCWPPTVVAVLEGAGTDALPHVLARVPAVVTILEKSAAEDDWRLPSVRKLYGALRKIVLAIGIDAIPHLEAVRDVPTLGAWAEKMLAELQGEE